MKVFVLDNSKNSMTILEQYLTKYADEVGIPMEIFGFTSPETFLKEYRESKEKPYLVFMELLLEGADGIEIARILRNEGSEARLIFTASSEQRVMETFHVHADGFLKKPFTYADLTNAMHRFQQRMAQESRTIQLRVSRSEVQLHTADIFYAESAGHSVSIHSRGGDYKAAISMNELAELLKEEKSFIVCGRSYLVNMLHIRQIDKETILMEDSTVIHIPVRLRKSIAEQYLKFKGEKA